MPHSVGALSINNNFGAMAHLGARQTEDLEVAGSSPACPNCFCFCGLSAVGQLVDRVV